MLVNGNVYIGTAGLDPTVLANQIVIYSDRALTTPIANPQKTDANGQTANKIWIPTTKYSIAVTNSSDVVKYLELDNGDIDTDASEVTYTASGTGAVQTTVNSKLNEIVSVKDYGAVGGGITDDTAAIQAAEDYADSVGASLFFPAGSYKCLTGINKKSVNWFGEGMRSSVLYYYGSGTLINATGTSPARIICTISDFGFDGSNGGATAKGITMGFNMRSLPFLNRVLIQNFGHYGIHFNDQNWIVDFTDVYVLSCGITTNNSSGIFKDAAVDASTWNAITFNNLAVEFCGTSSSTAGGIHLLTTTINRGVYFNDAMIEDNLGTEEIYIENVRDLQFKNIYMERTDVAGQSYGIALSDCDGGVHGGYISGAGSNNLSGLRVTNGSVMQIDAVDISGWTTAGIENYSSEIHTGKNPNTTYLNGDTSAQWFGSYAPRVSAHKNGTDQTGVVSGTYTKVTFGTERYDLTSAFASSTFTPQTIGTYQIDAQVDYTAALDQDVLIIAIYLNGAVYKESYTQTSGTTRGTVKISAQIDTAAVTDTIEIYTRQTSGSNKTISGGANNTWFMASLIGSK